MKRKVLSVCILFFSALLFLACSNLLGTENKASESKGISLTLPYGKSNTAGLFRAGEDSSSYIKLNFKVTFKHESGNESLFEGKSGETIVFEAAPTGKYTIYVKGYNEGNVLKYEGESEALVTEGETTTVTIKLSKVKGNEEPENPDVIEINLLGWTDEQAKMIEKYIETHPDCGIRVIFKQVETTNGLYTTALDAALTGESTDFVPDIYAAEAAFVLRYTHGEMSSHALPYDEFISDLENKISEADISQYTIDLGKNSSDKILGMAYQTTGGAFIYRRSVAEKVFGTSDSTRIKEAIGGGSGKWTKFFEAAASCADKGVAIVSGDSDLWHPVEGSAEAGWIVDSKLHIDSNREAFLDYSKKLWENGWSNKTTEWTEEWYADARGEGKKPVLGYFGPAWLINYVLEPQCNPRGDDGKLINSVYDSDWAICESPVGFFWGGTWMLVNNELKNDTSDEGKRKLEAVGKIIEWITLDATKDGLQYQWANGLLDNAKDTVASKAVMNMSDGTLDFLNGVNMFDYYVTANENARVDLLTEYDDKITAMWRFEVNKYAEGLTTREQALKNFKYAAYSQLGLKSDSLDADNFVYETEHVCAEKASDGKGIKFTLTAKEGESWIKGASFIWESVSGTGIRISDVPTPGNPKVCYWPLTEDGKGYEFNCNLNVAPGTNVQEKVYAIASGGNEYINIEGENTDLLLSGTKIKLLDTVTYTVNKSKNVKPYLNCDVYTTSKKNVANPWDVDWKQWLNSINLAFNDDIINTLKTDGYQVLNLNSQAMSRLAEDKYYFANLTLEFTIDGYPESFRSYASSYSNIVEYDINALLNNKSEHVTAEPDKDGKGIKFTISAKAGEEWREEDYRITELNSGIYIDLKKEKLPCPGKPVVCYWPLTKDGESYIFECEVKLKSQGNNIIRETVRSTAKGSYANVTVDFAAAIEADVIINSANATAKFSKDISSSINYSDNVTATFDFGTFANNSSNEYKWTEWLSSRFIPVNNKELYDSGIGISLLDRNRDTVVKLKNHKYFFTEATLNIEIEGIEDRFRSSNVYRTDIIDSSAFLANLNENTHISAEPCDEGVKITLRRLETDGEWCDGNVNNIICLADNGEDGVSINLVYSQDFWNNQIPDTHLANISPSSDNPVVTYIYPFTEKDKVYEFILAGPLDDREGEWKSEYVCCTAGGGIGELIDVDLWNNDINLTDFDYANHSFRITGDVSALIDNSNNDFTCANIWTDIRPGTPENGREETFKYSSMETCLIGNDHDNDWYRTIADLENPIVIQNHPDYGKETMDPNSGYNENVYDVLAEYNNLFWATMTVEEIRLASYPNMTFHLHWK